MNISLLLGSRYSLLSMRAMDLRAPNFLAIIAATILSFSSWFTAMNKSHLRTDARRNTSNVVESPSIETTSARLPTSANNLPSGSTMVISCPLPLNMRARWLPISPAPAMTIFMIRFARLCCNHPLRQEAGNDLQILLQMYTFAGESPNFQPRIRPCPRGSSSCCSR